MVATVSQKTASFLDIMCTDLQVGRVKAGKSESDGKAVQSESPGRSEFTSSGFGFSVTDIETREAKYQMNPHEKKRQMRST